jgi:hypothetical protein
MAEAGLYILLGFCLINDKGKTAKLPYLIRNWHENNLKQGVYKQIFFTSFRLKKESDMIPAIILLSF